MFSLRRSAKAPTWKQVEDDFVMGACSRRLFGYISRDLDGVWTAFDEEARVVAAGPDLADVAEALWAGHLAAHDEQCEPVGEIPWWRRVARKRGMPASP
ncbi:hypothetical protein RWH44_02500 [Microbacterium sp. KSW2-29]|uniref:Uncharacterized protein n=1 Tax=Microbacterium phycohabitans TaxID=3075993 RepID=A0ABU3SJK8_9MICO|nr:hypothetical protein [Microbacterium sp. KSW2-29]MDU0344565.1 hypothetical protein [Microbacterium sp. KSW2-29]